MITLNTLAVITRLKANTQYTVKVYVRNDIGYGVVSSKVITTKKIGKPAVPDLLTAILEQKESRLSVVLRWKEPDDNGGNITRYTIYTKEVEEKANWTKFVNITDLKELEYRITENIVDGKTYMFLVTAWNKYGESVRDEGDAKIVNTTATKATSTKESEKCPLQSTEKLSKTCKIVIGVFVPILVIFLGFNLLQLCLRKCGVKESPTQDRKTQIYRKSYENDIELEENTESTVAASPTQQPVLSVLCGSYGMVEQSSEYANPKTKATAGESHENHLELKKRTVSTAKASRTQHYAQGVSEYEFMDQLYENANPNEAHSSNDISNYKGLTSLPNSSSQGSPVTGNEPLRKRSDESIMKHDENEQHQYETIDIIDQKHAYQTPQTDGKESASET